MAKRTFFDSALEYINRSFQVRRPLPGNGQSSSIAPPDMNQPAGLMLNQVVYYPDCFETYINQGYAFNPTVYSCVNYLAKKVASIPFYVYEIQNQKAYRKYQAFIDEGKNFKVETKHKLKELQQKALKPIEDPTNLLQILMDQPNQNQSQREFFEATAAFYAMAGNSFLYLGRTKKGSGKELGMPTRIENLSPQYINIVSDGTLFGIKEYEWTLFGMQRYSADDIIQVRTFNPMYDHNGSHLFGMSPLRSALRSMQAGNEAYEALMRSFKNQGAYSLIMPEEGNTMTDPQLSELSGQISNKKGRPLITNGKFSVLSLGMSPTDMKILETLEISRADICGIYGLDSILFNDHSSATFSNKEEAKKASIVNGVAPIAWAIADAFNLDLVPWYNEFYGKKFCIEPDIYALSEMQVDQKEMTSWLKEAYWLTTKQKIEAMEYEYDPKHEEVLNQYLIPSGLKTLDQIINPPEPPPALGAIGEEAKKPPVKKPDEEKK